MKPNLQTNPLLLKCLVLVTCFMLAILYNKSQASSWPAVKSKVAVSFLQRSESNELNVMVKAASSADLQLYLFNTEGHLVKELTICPKKVTTIKKPGRGCYLYECFKDDTRMTSGSVIIK
ncbi:MAG: hypothetical protein V4725_06330 [Bacteroidota bacterium]|nr:hypothetical protein [Ferruginibacter sp.]